MQYNPARPTIAYTTLLGIVVGLVNMEATKSILNNPIDNQFNAPMITIINDNLSSGVLFIITAPFYTNINALIFNIIIFLKHKKIHTVKFNLISL